MHLDTPILFLVFNRPETTREVWAEIRTIKPRTLFVSGDGPRKEVQTDKTRCAETRAIVESIDWPCEATYFFRDQNVGCGASVASALNWFFDNVPEGIILEDDCVPDQSFFPYCEELLRRYRTDDRIMIIGGANYGTEDRNDTESYYFSAFPHIWGWAPSARAWKKYQRTLEVCPGKEKALLRSISRSRRFQKHWAKVFRRVRDGRVDTWDYQWVHAIWTNKGLAIIPTVNLVCNIGWGGESTHTKQSTHRLAHLPSHEMLFPLRHPQDILVAKDKDHWEFHRMICPKIPLAKRARRKRMEIVHKVRDSTLFYPVFLFVADFLRRLARLLDTYGRVSYAQEGEDLLLERMFGRRKQGFYVDVGAHHPVRFSNTYLLYRRGWRGINIDAMPGSMDMFRRLRPLDINLESAIGLGDARLTYYVFKEKALNTFDKVLAEERMRSGRALASKLEIRTRPLADLLGEHVPTMQRIDVLSVDVEGLDLDVLKSNDWQRVRPRVVIVEGLRQSTGGQHASVHDFLINLGYCEYARTYNSAFYVAAGESL